MVPIPAIADISDDMQRVRERTSGDYDESIDAALSAVEQFFEREFEDEESTTEVGLLEEADETLLALEERVDDSGAETHVLSARRRLGRLRDALTEADSEIAVIGTNVSIDEGREESKIADVEGSATVSVEVVNVGEPTDVAVDVRVTDADGVDLTTNSTTVPFDATEQRTVGVDVEVPGGARNFEASARPA